MNPGTCESDRRGCCRRWKNPAWNHERCSNKAALKMIDVWAYEQGIVIGYEAVPEATSETGVLPDLLRVLEGKDPP